MSSFIAGRYTATWNALDIGQTAEGLTLSYAFAGQLIKGDAWAQTTQDEVYQGVPDFTVSCRLIEYDAAAVATMAWFPSATIWGVGIVGRTSVGSTIAKSLVLTAVAGTPAIATPATLTMLLTKIKEGFPIELLFAPALREVPIQLRVFPSVAGGIFATQT